MADYKILFGNRIYLYSGATLITLFVALLLVGLRITGSDDVCKGTPDDPCVSYGTICNPLPKNIDIYNPNETKLGFTPEIKEYWIFFKDGRVKKEFLSPKGITQSTLGWRYENFTNATKSVSTAKYVHRFGAYSCQSYMLVGLKNNPNDKIKWGFCIGNECLDPIWDSLRGGEVEVYINGINASQKVEFGTSLNISYAINGTIDVCIDIDAPNYGKNYSCTKCASPPCANWTWYNATLLRQSSLSGYNLSTSGDNLTIVMDNRTELIEGSFNISGDLGSEICYQESANISTSCGGINTGNYSITGAGNASNPTTYFDGDWNTYAANLGNINSETDFYINYTKPTNTINSSLWQIKNGDGAGTVLMNISIGDCWNMNNQLVFRVNMSCYGTPSCSNKLKYDCFNGSEWINIRTDSIEPGQVWEEAMQWNISGDYPTDISLYGENKIIAKLPDYLNKTNLTHKNFIYEGVKSSSTNITYVTADTETIYINMSGSGDKFYNITMQLSGSDIDTENSVDYTQYFNSSNNTISDVDINTAQNVEVIGEYDNFERNTTTSVWEITDTGGCVTSSETWESASDSYFYIAHATSGSESSCSGYISNSEDTFDLKNYTYIEQYIYLSKACYIDPAWCSCAQEARLDITDGTNIILMYALSGTGTETINITYKKVTMTSWQVYKNNIYQSTIDLSSLNQANKWNLRYFTSAELGRSSCQGQPGAYSNAYMKVYRIQANGLWLNKTWNGTEFTGNGSVCMDVLANTSITHNYTAVWIEGKEYKPTGTDIKYSVSANNLTTKQLTVNNARTIFNVQGNKLTGCVNLSGSNETSPVVYDLRWRVIPASITDIYIDAGDNGDTDFNQSGKLNSTTSPWNISLDTDDILTYKLSYSSDKNFLFPISISTGSEGLLQISNLESKQNPNPIILNVSVLENCYLCKLGAIFTGGILNITSFALDFLGSWNYTVTAHIANYTINNSHKLMVKYSKFNCTFPQEITYFEPFPIMSQNSKNVTPLGQEINYCNTSSDLYCKSTSIPIFNCTYYGYDEDRMNLTIALNQTYFTASNISQDLTDKSGYNHNVTNKGATFITGKLGLGVTFPPNTLINFTDRDLLTSRNWTIAFWAQSNNQLSPQQGYYYSDDRNATNLYLRGGTDPSCFNGGIWPSNVQTFCISTLLTQWTLFTSTYTWNGTNGNYSWWVDGVFRTNTTTSTFNNLTGNFMIGNRPALDRDLNGTMDEISMWNRALSAGEVNATYIRGLNNQSINVTDGLVLYFPFSNTSQNQGIDTFMNSNITKINAINLTNSTRYLTQINKTQSEGIWGWTDFWNASLNNITNFNPDFIFNAYCAECLH